MRFNLDLCLPLAIATIVACGCDTSLAGSAPSLTVLGGKAASPAAVSMARFEPPRSIGTPKAEVARVRQGGETQEGR